MFRKLIFSAFGAGLAVCVAVSVLQQFTTEPLILGAEVYEKAAGATHDHMAATLAAAAAPSVAPAEEGWQPADGFERTAYTALANLLVGIAISLVLLGAMGLKGETIDARRGLLWGLAGFAAASLLPALGLPPELPATPSADLLPRQAWWLATAAASGLGIFLLVYGNGWLWRALALVLIVAPHVIGAPEPPSLVAAYPAAMAADFVIASLIVSAAVWLLAGLASGWLHQRLARAE